MNQLLDFLRRPLPYRQYNMVFILIVINVVAYILSSIAPILTSIFSMNLFLVLNKFFIWQPFTYMFMHANTTHIFFNMLGLYFFGVAVERELGSWEFLLFYLLCGTLAGVFSLFIYMLLGMNFVFLLGASGAIFSVLLAFATINPRARVFIFGIFPISAAAMVLVFTGLELLLQLNAGASSNVARFTHLSGFLFAYCYFYIRFGINPIDRLLNRR